MRPNGNCCNGYGWPIELYFIAANWLDYALNSTIRDFETTVGHCYSTVMWFWDNYTDQKWAQVISIDVLHLPPLVGEKFLRFCNVSILIQKQDGIFVGRVVSGPLFPFRQVGPCGFFFLVHLGAHGESCTDILQMNNFFIRMMFVLGIQ